MNIDKATIIVGCLVAFDTTLFIIGIIFLLIDERTPTIKTIQVLK